MRHIFALVAIWATGAACASTSPRFDAPTARYPTADNTLAGQVVGLGAQTPSDSLENEVRIEVRPESERPVSVKLAPGWYLDRHGLHFALEDQVTVTGAFEADSSVFVAHRIRKGNTDVKLRDASGKPVWQTPAPASTAPPTPSGTGAPAPASSEPGAPKEP